MNLLRVIIFLVIIGFFFYLLISFISPNYFLVPEASKEPVSPPEYGYKNVKIGGEVFRLEIADTSFKQVQGLSGRDGLAENEGMLFLFSKPGKYGFWMKGMKFPLDIIWLKGGEIVDFVENAPSEEDQKLQIYYPKSEADAVVELNAGMIKRLNLKTGERLTL